jgi:hypothetical protein
MKTKILRICQFVVFGFVSLSSSACDSMFRRQNFAQVQIVNKSHHIIKRATISLGSKTFEITEIAVNSAKEIKWDTSGTTYNNQYQLLILFDDGRTVQDNRNSIGNGEIIKITVLDESVQTNIVRAGAW